MLAYQWTVDGADVVGATGAAYTPVAADVGKVITVKVTGTRTGYASVTKESVATAAVALGDLTLAPMPTISGTPKFGEHADGRPRRLGHRHDAHLPVARGRRARSRARPPTLPPRR